MSLLDFTIYTLNFIYGLVLAVPRLKGLEKVFYYDFLNLICGKVMPLVVGILFLGVRFLYVPFLYVLIPISGMPRIPAIVFKVTFFGLAVLYITLLLLPLIFGAISAVKYRLWRNSKRGDFEVLQAASQRVNKRLQKYQIPQTVIVMPIYNEEPDALVRAVESVTKCVYPQRYVSCYLSFDNAEESDLYLHLMKYLTNGAERPAGGYPSRVHLVFQKVHFVVNRFPHGGKRHAQALTFNEIKHAFYGKEDDTFLLFIDSDIVLHEDCLIEFVRAMDKQPNLIGMTGFISAM